MVIIIIVFTDSHFAMCFNRIYFGTGLFHYCTCGQCGWLVSWYLSVCQIIIISFLFLPFKLLYSFGMLITQSFGWWGHYICMCVSLWIVVIWSALMLNWIGLIFTYLFPWQPSFLVARESHFLVTMATMFFCCYGNPISFVALATSDLFP